MIEFMRPQKCRDADICAEHLLNDSKALRHQGTGKRVQHSQSPAMGFAEVSRPLSAFVAALKLAPLPTPMGHAEAPSHIYFAAPWLCASVLHMYMMIW